VDSAPRITQINKESQNQKDSWNIAVLLSHPIQYQVPLMRRLSEHEQIKLAVFFMSDTGLQEKYVKGYGETIKWDIPLLEGYDFRFLPNLSPKANKSSFWSRFNPGIISELRRGHYDALMLHGYSSPTEWLALMVARFSGIPVFFRGEVVWRSPRGWFPPKWLKEIFLRSWCRRIDAALPINSAAKNFYEHYGVSSERMFWAPYAVDNDVWMSKAAELASKKAELKMKLGLAPDLPVILFVAHMRENKRPLDLIAAFERITTPASLLMVGAGPLYREITDYCSQRRIKCVHLPGVKNQTELPTYYTVADVFVLPSGPVEVSPLVVKEAMFFGLPIILSDAIPSATDFVCNGQNGYIYKMGQVDELAARIDAILSDSVVKRQMREESRKKIGAWNYDLSVGAILQSLEFVSSATGTLL
jgi:glycosyltransferase involved in cell wall biosynthesis